MEQRNKAVYKNDGFDTNENHAGSEPNNATKVPKIYEEVKLDPEMTPESSKEDTKNIQSNVCL